MLTSILRARPAVAALLTLALLSGCLAPSTFTADEVCGLTKVNVDEFTNVAYRTSPRVVSTSLHDYTLQHASKGQGSNQFVWLVTEPRGLKDYVENVRCDQDSGASTLPYEIRDVHYNSTTGPTPYGVYVHSTFHQTVVVRLSESFIDGFLCSENRDSFKLRFEDASGYHDVMVVERRFLEGFISRLGADGVWPRG